MSVESLDMGMRLCYIPLRFGGRSFALADFFSMGA
jgi:hypothetical protein